MMIICEHNDVPGVCVMSNGGVTFWTPIKLSKSRVKAVTVDSDSSQVEICLKDCLSLDYQPHDGVPGFDIETSNDSFLPTGLVVLHVVDYS